MNTFDKDIQDRLKELTELYTIVKEIVIYSEENDPEKRADIQVINEMRNAFDHLMRLYAAYFGIEHNADSEYMKINLDKAFAHVYRAGYDALDRTTLFLRKYIANEMGDFSLETINSVFPEYYRVIRTDIEEINEAIAKGRVRKDVGNPNFESFIDYVKLMKKLGSYYKEVLKKKSSLIEYEDKLKKVLIKAVKASGANIIETKLYQFNPHGLTGIITVSYTHLTLPTKA